MTHEQLLAGLLLPLPITLLPLLYLRKAMRPMLTDLCGTAQRADFWLRATLVLALLGALIISLFFGLTTDTDWVEQLRRLLLASLAGSFIAVALVTRGLWRAIARSGFVPLPPLPQEMPE